jgi:hypothetical protein
MSELKPPMCGPAWIWRWQPQAEVIYQDIKIQLFVASLIVTNFLTFMISKQIDPAEQKYSSVWAGLDLFYNAIFLLELLLNMYGSWLCVFWSSPWNVFDFMVVSIGVLDTAKVDLGPLRMLRMMRAFRVFRLFKKIESLNKIIMSLLHAIPGMVNAFLINLIFMCIYAVLAVDFFGYIGEDCETNPEKTQFTITSRDNCFGVEYYGNFAKSLYTLFQVLTGDSWSEAVVRPIIGYYDEPHNMLGTGMFFVSFIIINAIVLINVVVAVLLDKMADTPPVEEEGAIVEGAQEEKPAVVETGPEAENALLSSLAGDVKAIETGLAELRTLRQDVDTSRSEMGALRTQLSAILTVLERPSDNSSTSPKPPFVDFASATAI